MMMELIHHVLNFEGAAAQPVAQVGGNEQENHHPISTGAGNATIERRAVLKSSEEEGEQVLDSMTEVRLSPRQEPSVPSSQQDRVISPVKETVNLKSAAPPEDATEDFGKGNRGVKRKASSGDDIEETVQLNDDDVEELNDDDVEELNDDDDEETVQLNDDDVEELNDDYVEELNDDDVEEYARALETRNKLVVEAIELVLTRNRLAAEATAKAQELWFYKEMDYLEKRDRQRIRIQKKMVSAISGVTKVLMTELQNTEGGVDAINYVNAINAGGVDVVDTDILQ